MGVTFRLRRGIGIKMASQSNVEAQMTTIKDEIADLKAQEAELDLQASRVTQRSVIIRRNPPPVGYSLYCTTL